MGWHFSLQEASTIAWLTAPRGLDQTIPLDDRDADRLFIGIASKRPDEIGIISIDPSWPREIHQDCLDYSRSHVEFSTEAVQGQLARFRRHFQDFNLFALGVPGTNDDLRGDSPLHAFLQDGAFSSREFGLFLILEESGATGELLFPFPAFRLVGAVPLNLPAVLFWTPTGSAAYCSLNDARDLYGRIRPIIDDLRAVDRVLEEYAARASLAPVLLQLSDLHFGTDRARDTQNYLLQAIEQLAKSRPISRVVITGDLFDNPNRDHEAQFIGFRQRLHSIVGSDPIVIPGNHDQRAWLGMFRRQLRQAADLEWANLVAVHQLQMVFLCFDSSRDGDGARGRVNEQQRLDMAAAFDNLKNREPGICEFLRVVLVHHHPFTFDLPASGWWRVLERLGFREERFLRMDDAEEFVKWCAHRGASLILHGHKHVPYRAQGSVWIDNQVGNRVIPSIGCGSSTGAGNLPLSMNLLTFFPAQRRWASSFLIDPGDGRGFAEQHIDVHALDIN